MNGTADLPSDLGDFVSAEMQRGLYSTQAEVVRAGLRALQREINADEEAILPHPRDWSDYLTNGPVASNEFMENVTDLPIEKR